MSTILLVDDDRTLLSCLAEGLARSHYAVIARYSALSALETVRSGVKFDLVVTDYRMDRMDGIEFLHRLRYLHPFVPAVVLTGHATLDGFLKAKGLGVVQFLEKPFRTRELIRTIDRLMAITVDVQAHRVTQTPVHRGRIR